MTPIEAPVLPQVSEPQLDVLRGYPAGLTHARKSTRLGVAEHVAKKAARLLCITSGAKGGAHAVGIASQSGLLTDNDMLPGRGQSR
jgi:hypothetical protein